MRRRLPLRIFVALVLAVAVGLATAVSPHASPSPDGLEKVAQQQGFLQHGRLHELQRDAPLPGYAFPGIADPRLATGVAGFVGTLGVFALGYGVAFAISRRRRVRSLSAGTA